MFTQATRFLVIDDLATIRNLVKSHLLEIGFRDVEMAADGQEGVAMLRKSIAEKKIYDVIISDWNMPKMTGLELLQFCRKTPELAQVPVIFLTIESDHKQILKAVSEGVSDYIVKPFTVETLRKKLEVLQKKRAKAVAAAGGASAGAGPGASGKH